MRRSVLCVLLLFLSTLYADECCPKPLFSFGGGCFDISRPKRCGLMQFEYKDGRYLWYHIRQQACLIVPKFSAIFIGYGLSWDFYLTRHFVFSPSFMPGLYFRTSREAKNLGFPVEFRSAVEFSYEFTGGARLGTQFYHISNASLSHRNPGANAWTLFFAFPLKKPRWCCNNPCLE